VPCIRQLLSKDIECKFADSKSIDSISWSERERPLWGTALPSNGEHNLESLLVSVILTRKTEGFLKTGEADCTIRAAGEGNVAVSDPQRHDGSRVLGGRNSFCPAHIRTTPRPRQHFSRKI